MEFEPLYSAGFHDISIEKLDDIFVKPFADNERRKYLTGRFLVLMNEFSELGINFEIWLDGSYSTQKEIPGDIDILLVFNENEVNKLSFDKRARYDELTDRQQSKIRYSIDVLHIISNDETMRSYWRGWFGFSRTEKPKGIPRLYYGSN